MVEIMHRFIIRSFIGIFTLCSACTVTPHSPSTELFDGVWTGYGEPRIINNNTTCHFSRIAIRFEVKDGIATSTIMRPGLMFKVPINKDGSIKFSYEEYDKRSKKQRKIVFVGKLSFDGSGGTLSSGNCSGKWEVFQKLSQSELQKRAEQGSASSQYQLGKMYNRFKSYKIAVSWYLKAAIQGHAYAQNDLGNAYYRGHGVKQDFATAFAWFKLSSEKGNFEAITNLKLFTEIQIEEGERRYRELKKKYNFN